MSDTDALFSNEGEDRVRLNIMTGGYNATFMPLAVAWLAKKDQASRSRNELSQASQIRTARSAKKAAWIAAIAAIAASVLTIIGIVISYLAWQHPNS